MKYIKSYTNVEIKLRNFKFEKNCRNPAFSKMSAKDSPDQLMGKTTQEAENIIKSKSIVVKGTRD